MWVEVTGRFKLAPSGAVSGNTEWQVHKHVPSAGKTPVKIKAVPSNRNPRVAASSQTEAHEQKMKMMRFSALLPGLDHRPFIYHIRVLQR